MLKFSRTCVLAAAVVAGTASAQMDRPELAVVSLRYLITEQSPEHLEKIIVQPLERILVALPRVSEVTSIASHGSVDFEIKFYGGASAQDLTTVARHIDEFALDDKMNITSRIASLASPRL